MPDMRASVLVACSLPDEAIDILRQSFVVHVLSDSERPNPDEVARLSSGMDVLICSVTLKVDRKLIAALSPSTLAVATYSVGMDHLDLQACRDHQLAVFNTPDVLSEAVAEVAMLLLLAAARRAQESSTLIRSGAWKGWQPTQLNGIQLSGRTLGILGMGRIGREIAARARSFGMSIAYCNRTKLTPELESGARYYADAEKLLTAADAFIFAWPATPETERFVDRRRIALMKPGALIVNISRGSVVDDDALIEALASGRVAGAGLDVFNGEPNFDQRYLDLPNVFMLPHIGSSTIETRVRMAEALATSIKTFLEEQARRV